MGKKGGAHTLQVPSRARRRLARTHGVIERDALTDADEITEATAAVVGVLGNAFSLCGEVSQSGYLGGLESSRPAWAGVEEWRRRNARKGRKGTGASQHKQED